MISSVPAGASVNCCSVLERGTEEERIADEFPVYHTSLESTATKYSELGSEFLIYSTLGLSSFAENFIFDFASDLAVILDCISSPYEFIFFSPNPSGAPGGKYTSPFRCILARTLVPFVGWVP
jgi:hypothetical protein